MSDLDLGLEERPDKAKGGGLFIVFLIGLVVGIVGTLLVPRYLGPYLPSGLGGGGVSLQGPVLGKRQEDGRLLLTVQAEQGAVLATFSERVAEIDLLVDVGDTVSLGVPGYEPFIDDPTFRGIRKAPAPPTEPDQLIEPDQPIESDQPTGAAAATDTPAGEESSAVEADAPPLGLPRSDGAPSDTAG